LRQIPQSDRTPAQQQRLVELVANQQNIAQSFNNFLNQPDVADAINQLSRTARRQNLDLESLNALQDNLHNLNQNAVLFYPLILDDRLELVLVTPYSPPIRHTVNVNREELNEAIAQFRSRLTSRTSRSLTEAEQLYQWLIAPVKNDLQQANAQTILYAPDGQLRYIPLAALHDGEHWLIEQYRINYITTASLTDFDAPRQQPLSVLAGAFTEGNYSFEVGTRQFSYSGLPFARIEVQTIAYEIPITTELVDRAFSPQSMIPRMDDYSVVHLATHAKFVTGSPDDSFILFGNGDRITLRDISSWSLPNVDLVVLSACETAVGGELGNGEEILGFGYQMQRTGARAAIASLWQVSDGGTQVLMNAFYAGLERGMTKAEALQQAQIALITGDFTAVGGDRGTIQILSTRTGLPQQVSDRLDHPYYWAPFILIGNGL
jgi:CHAT domain-containing protein